MFNTVHGKLLLDKATSGVQDRIDFTQTQGSILILHTAETNTLRTLHSTNPLLSTMTALY
jgi:hypothetical protein